MYNAAGVTQIELNDTQETYAKEREYSATPDAKKRFTLEPGQQIVGINGRFKGRGSGEESGVISWFNFVYAKPEWKGMGPSALYV